MKSVFIILALLIAVAVATPKDVPADLLEKFESADTGSDVYNYGYEPSKDTQVEVDIGKLQLEEKNAPKPVKITYKA